MSVNKKIMIIFALLFAAAMSISGPHFENAKERRLAGYTSSTDSQKLMGKSYPQPVTIRLSGDFEPPAPPQKPFVITATISAERDLLGKIEWLLPKGVKLVSGERQKNLSLVANTPAQESITIEVPDINNYQIFAILKYKVQNQVLSTVTQLVTNPQAMDPIHYTPVSGKVLFAKPKLMKRRGNRLDSPEEVTTPEETHEKTHLDESQPPPIVQ
jgi:hypothetical protein